LTYQQSVFKRYYSDKHFSEFLPTRWRQKPTAIDMEQNYVTVTLCIFPTVQWHNQADKRTDIRPLLYAHRYGRVGVIKQQQYSSNSSSSKKRFESTQTGPAADADN